jgi:hypothetical protein
MLVFITREEEGSAIKQSRKTKRTWHKTNILPGNAHNPKVTNAMITHLIPAFVIICINTVSLVSSWALLLMKTQNGTQKVMHALIGFQERWAFKSAMMTSMVQSAISSDMISQRAVSTLHVFSFRSRS